MYNNQEIVTALFKQIESNTEEPSTQLLLKDFAKKCCSKIFHETLQQLSIEVIYEIILTQWCLANPRHTGTLIYAYITPHSPNLNGCIAIQQLLLQQMIRHSL